MNDGFVRLNLDLNISQIIQPLQFLSLRSFRLFSLIIKQSHVDSIINDVLYVIRFT